MRFYFKITVFLVLSLIAVGGNNVMAKMYLFSDVSGFVVKDGKPVQGAVVEQEFRWAWEDEVGIKTVETGVDGGFSFPAVIRSSFLGALLPHEPMIEQTILIKYQENVYKAWVFDKRVYGQNSELDGKSINIYCELGAPLTRKGDIYGICQLK